MYDDATQILNFLPISRQEPESAYINHLFDAIFFMDLAQEGRPFSIMPFHLLFMLALQYKVLRVAEAEQKSAELFFTVAGGRSKDQLLSPKRSVFDIALISERTIPEIFQIVGCDGAIIKEIKKLIDERNDTLAHAKGGIEPDPDGKIGKYLEILEKLQPFFLSINNKIAENWKSEKEADEDLSDFVHARLLDSLLCPEDFKTGILASDFSIVTEPTR